MKENLSRREALLAGLGIIAAGSLHGKEASAQEAQEQSTDLQNLIVRYDFDVTFDKLSIPENRKEISPEIEVLLNALSEFTKNIMKHDGVTSIQAQQELFKLFINLKISEPVFTQENFYKVFITKIPKLLVNYGIILETTTRVIRDENGRITNIYFGLRFHRIKKFDSEKKLIDGKVFNIDIAHVKQLEIRGKIFDTEHDRNSLRAQTYGQNILIYDDAINNEWARYLKDEKQLLDRFHEMSDNDILATVEDYNGDEQDAMADEAVRICLLRRSAAHEGRNDLSNLIAHETGHVLNIQEPNYKKKNAPIISRDQELQNQWFLNTMARTETRAKISELQLMSNKYWALAGIYLSKSGQHRTTTGEQIIDGHAIANRRLRNAIRRELTENMSLYGIKILKGFDITPNNQAVFHIINIAKDEQKINFLTRRLLERYNIDNDMGEKAPSIPRTAVDKQSTLFDTGESDHFGWYVAGGIAALSTAYALLEKLRKRKEDVASKKGKKPKKK
jgi:hypothetical protein